MTFPGLFVGSNNGIVATGGTSEEAFDAHIAGETPGGAPSVHLVTVNKGTTVPADFTGIVSVSMMYFETDVGVAI